MALLCSQETMNHGTVVIMTPGVDLERSQVCIPPLTIEDCINFVLYCLPRDILNYEHEYQNSCGLLTESKTILMNYSCLALVLKSKPRLKPRRYTDGTSRVLPFPIPLYSIYGYSSLCVCVSVCVSVTAQYGLPGDLDITICT